MNIMTPKIANCKSRFAKLFVTFTVTNTKNSQLRKFLKILSSLQKYLLEYTATKNSTKI